MKLGILTLVPYDNYGGILQGYALQTVLERMGHNVNIFNTKLYNWIPRKLKCRLILRWFKNRIVFRKKDWPCINVFAYQDYRVAKITPFIRKNIKLTRTFRSTDDLCAFQEFEGYDGFVVGSDQTWRPCLSPDLYHMFCDFLPMDSRKLRIAYAASFGVEKNEFTEEQLNKCKQLLSKFDAVSVREESGIQLCKELFGVKAEQVLDPTLLLEKDDYLNLIKDYRPRNPNIELMQYVFFFNKEENKIIKKVSEIMGMHPVNLMTKYFLNQVDTKEKLEDAQFQPVEEWIYAYSHSKFVLTDSFHGTVFCIIFNVPFLCVSPVAITRFKSLLALFGLENRLVLTVDEVTSELINQVIDWKTVNIKRQELKKQSIFFIEKSLAK